MHRAVAVVLSLISSSAQAHPAHGEFAVHLHGFTPEMLLIAALAVAWLWLRSG